MKQKKIEWYPMFGSFNEMSNSPNIIITYTYYLEWVIEMQPS